MDAATRERNTTLERMVIAKAITRADADAAKLEPIEVRPKWRREARESYAMDAIRNEMERTRSDINRTVERVAGNAKRTEAQLADQAAKLGRVAVVHRGFGNLDAGPGAGFGLVGAVMRRREKAVVTFA